MSAAEAHGAQCVCVECMRAKFPRGDVVGHAKNCVCSWCLASRPLPTLGDAYRGALTPKRRQLTQKQTRLLSEFTEAWNRDLKKRGREPVREDEALTEGLRALLELVNEGAKAI